MKIAFLIPTREYQFDPEEEAAYQWLRRHFKNTELMTAEDVVTDRRHIDLFWLHYVSTCEIPFQFQSRRFIRSLKSRLKAGSGFLGSFYASVFPTLLGIESVPPNRRSAGRWQIEDSYKEIRGFHGFNGHPVFHGLSGGVFTWNPVEGDWFVLCEYDGALPKSGKIVATSRSYIRLNESERPIIEHVHGKGRILTIGSDFYFSRIKNMFQTDFDTFAHNVIRYVGGALDGKRSYWSFDSPTISLVRPPGDSAIRLLPKQVTSIKKYTGDCLSREHATDAYIEAAGERILCMGNEARGVREIWVHPFRFLRNLRVSGRVGNLKFDSTTTPPAIEVFGAGIRRSFRLGSVVIEESTIVHPTKPGGMCRWTFPHGVKKEIAIEFESSFRRMWPFSGESIGPSSASWDPACQCVRMQTNTLPFHSIAGIIGKSHAHSFSIRSVPSDDRDAKTTIDVLDTRIEIQLGETEDILEFIFSASGQDRQECEETYREIAKIPDRLFKLRDEWTRRMIEPLVRLRTNQDDFNQGYGWALTGMLKFFVRTPGVGTGFMAGYNTTRPGWCAARPGYAWYFGRDSVWTSFAALSAGAFLAVHQNLELLIHWQNSNGKIFHELTSSGVVHYDAADSTPLFLVLCGRYLRASGDKTYIRRRWKNIRLAMQYCESTDSDADGLIENTNVGHGWIEGGKLYGAHVTLYLASVWCEALKESAYCAAALNQKADATRWKRSWRRVLEIIRTEFWNSEDEWFYEGKYSDGTYQKDKTIEAAVPVLFGQATIDQASILLPECDSEEFSTDWGSRIVGRSHPYFNPTGYHYGSVWPLFTGWHSLADYKAGRPVQGFRNIMATLSNYRTGALGFVEEVFHGEEHRSAGVCHHQAWSESMGIQPVLEGLLGFEPDAPGHQIRLSPQFPDDWTNCECTNLRCANTRYCLEFSRDPGNGIVYSMKLQEGEPFDVVIHFSELSAPRDSVVRINGKIREKFNGVLRMRNVISSEINIRPRSH